MTLTIKYKDPETADTILTLDTNDLMFTYITPGGAMNHCNIDHNISNLNEAMLKSLWDIISKINTNTISEVIIKYDIVEYHKINGINTFDYSIHTTGNGLCESLIIWG